MVRKEITDFGKVFYFEYPEYGFAMYVYDDDDDTIYLSNVKVLKTARGTGLGNMILDNAIKCAKDSNKKSICLKCLVDSWVHGWYSRHGFQDLCVDEEDERYIWMILDL